MLNVVLRSDNESAIDGPKNVLKSYNSQVIKGVVITKPIELCYSSFLRLYTCKYTPTWHVTNAPGGGGHF